MRKNVKIISQKEGISRNFVNYKTNEDGTRSILQSREFKKFNNLTHSINETKSN